MQMVEFRLEGGGSVLIESRSPAPPGAQRTSRAGTIIETAHTTFEKAIDNVKPVADALLSRLKALDTQPKEVTVEFGVTLSGELGAIIASTAAECSCKVTLTWQRPA